MTSDDEAMERNKVLLNFSFIRFRQMGSDERDIFVGLLIFAVISLGAVLACLLCLTLSVWITFFCKFKRKPTFGE